MHLAKFTTLTILAVTLTATVAAAQQQGPYHGGTVASCTFGSSCMSAAGGGDHTCATSTGASQSLVITNFGFDLPDSATNVAGFNVEPRFADLGCQGSIQLVKDGAAVGTPVTLPSYYADMCSLTQYFYLGGSTDLWGTTWTPDDVEDADFGVQIDSQGCTSGISVDTVRIIVHFTIEDAVCSDGYVTGVENCDDGNDVDGDGCSGRCREEVPLTSDQQKCVNKANSAAAKLYKFVSGTQKKCVKAHAKGSTDLQECLNDPKLDEKLQKTFQKLVPLVEDCEAALPPFVPVGVEAAAFLSSVMASRTYTDLVGMWPDDYVSGDKEAAGCQAAVLAGKEAVVLSTLSSFNKCVKTALAGKTAEPADSIVDLYACMPAKPAGTELGLLGALTDKCAGQPLDELLSGDCAGAPSDSARAECLATVSYCYACVIATEGGDSDQDCDLLDNGADDDSCTLF